MSDGILGIDVEFETNISAERSCTLTELQIYFQKYIMYGNLETAEQISSAIAG